MTSKIEGLNSHLREEIEKNQRELQAMDKFRLSDPKVDSLKKAIEQLKRNNVTVRKALEELNAQVEKSKKKAARRSGQISIKESQEWVQLIYLKDKLSKERSQDARVLRYIQELMDVYGSSLFYIDGCTASRSKSPIKQPILLLKEGVGMKKEKQIMDHLVRANVMENRHLASGETTKPTHFATFSLSEYYKNKKPFFVSRELKTDSDGQGGYYGPGGRLRGRHMVSGDYADFFDGENLEAQKRKGAKKKKRKITKKKKSKGYRGDGRIPTPEEAAEYERHMKNKKEMMLQAKQRKEFEEQLKQKLAAKDQTFIIMADNVNSINDKMEAMTEVKRVVQENPGLTLSRGDTKPLNAPEKKFLCHKSTQTIHIPEPEVSYPIIKYPTGHPLHVPIQKPIEQSTEIQILDECVGVYFEEKEKEKDLTTKPNTEATSEQSKKTRRKSRSKSKRRSSKSKNKGGSHRDGKFFRSKSKETYSQRDESEDYDSDSYDSDDSNPFLSGYSDSEDEETRPKVVEDSKEEVQPQKKETSASVEEPQALIQSPFSKPPLAPLVSPDHQGSITSSEEGNINDQIFSDDGEDNQKKENSAENLNEPQTARKCSKNSSYEATLNGAMEKIEEVVGLEEEEPDKEVKEEHKEGSQKEAKSKEDLKTPSNKSEKAVGKENPPEASRIEKVQAPKEEQKEPSQGSIVLVDDAEILQELPEQLSKKPTPAGSVAALSEGSKKELLASASPAASVKPPNPSPKSLLSSQQPSPEPTPPPLKDNPFLKKAAQGDKPPEEAPKVASLKDNPFLKKAEPKAPPAKETKLKENAFVKMSEEKKQAQGSSKVKALQGLWK